MGFALAEAAVTAGHQVTLISGPVALTAPQNVTSHRIESAQEMADAVRSLCETNGPDIAIHAAAVADYRPSVRHNQKIKKHTGTLTLDLERTIDVLGSMRSAFGFAGFLVGFAAETENLIPNAMDKLRRKGCDLVIANDVSRPDTGFDSDENEVVLCFPSGETEMLPKQSKHVLARQIIRRVAELAREKLLPVH